MGLAKRLFLSVEWSSGHFPDKLVVAMQNFHTVYSAWDGDKLIGMICVMDDGVMNAYVHYLLVDPDYHGKTIGRTLVSNCRLTKCYEKMVAMQPLFLLDLIEKKGGVLL